MLRTGHEHINRPKDERQHLWRFQIESTNNSSDFQCKIYWIIGVFFSRTLLSNVVKWLINKLSRNVVSISMIYKIAGTRQSQAWFKRFANVVSSSTLIKFNFRRQLIQTSHYTSVELNRNSLRIHSHFAHFAYSV